MALTNVGSSKNDYEYWFNRPSSYTNATTNTLVKTGDGILTGLSINSTSGGTYKIWDSTVAATTVLINTTTSSTGVIIYPNVKFSTGLFISLSTTADVTVFYK